MAAPEAKAQAAHSASPFERVPVAAAARSPATSHFLLTRAHRHPMAKAMNMLSEYVIDSTKDPGKKQKRATARSATAAPRSCRTKNHSRMAAVRPHAYDTAKAE